MKTITFALQKGGVGKTSISVATALELAKKHKVILLDADPQGNATTWLLGDKIKYELSDALNEIQPPLSCIAPTSFKNLFVIGTAGLNGTLREFQKNKASSSPNAILDITEALEGKFDYCIIDTSPSFDPLNESVFIASDEIITVLQLNEFSKDGLQIFTENLKSCIKRHRIPANKAQLNKIVLNCIDNRIRLQAKYKETLDNLTSFGFTFFLIPIDQAFTKAQMLKTTIFSKETGAIAKQATIKEIRELINAISLKENPPTP